MCGLCSVFASAFARPSPGQERSPYKQHEHPLFQISPEGVGGSVTAAALAERAPYPIRCNVLPLEMGATEDSVVYALCRDVAVKNRNPRIDSLYPAGYTVMDD